MFLKGEKITLRALEPTDVDILYTWENDVGLWPVSSTITPFSRFVMEEFVTAAHQDIFTNKQLRLMVNDCSSGTTVGAVDLYEFDPQHQRCGVGIYISEQSRGRGYAGECIQLIKNYCFTMLHLKQVYVYINASNSPSLSLFEKSGFVKTGLKRSWARTGPEKYEDVWFMQCLNHSA
jgi:diamine N-acetyltransferase